MIAFSTPDTHVDTGGPLHCDKCGCREDEDTTGAFITLEHFICPATLSSPAESELQIVCPSCAERLTHDPECPYDRWEDA